MTVSRPSRFRFAALPLALSLLASACVRQDRREPVALTTARCGSAAERDVCRAEPLSCVCEAYGDCEMPNCIALGEVVAAQRARAAASPDTPRAAAPPALRVAIDTGPRHCREESDYEQCREESYYCPCEAYGDCGRTYCVEPRVKPREPAKSCKTDDDRDLCRTDPRACPCAVNGLCGMPECDRR